jgi:hypothetical protein
MEKECPGVSGVARRNPCPGDFLSCEELVGRHQSVQGGGEVGDEGDKLAGTQVSRVLTVITRVLHSILRIYSFDRGGVRNVRFVMNIVFTDCIFQAFFRT